ncbi:MAG: trigger factor, partial [Thermodesulfobacteriota bacterium]
MDDIKVEVEDISPVEKRLTVEIPAGEVASEVNAAYRSLKADATLDGFRPGKVPENVLRRRFGARVREEVTARLIERTYPEALKGRDIMPVAHPRVEVKETGEGKGLVYSATVEVRPAVEVTGYRGMGLIMKPAEATDKEVADGLERLRESRGEFREVRRPAGTGDMVTIDFEGKVGGEPFKGGSARDFPAVIGGLSLLPGFDEALTAASAGDSREVKADLPGNYADEGLRGKEAVFEVKVKSVKEKVLPAVDDEFAKDLECESIEELKEKISAEIKRGKERSERDRLKSEAVERLVDKNPFDVPGALVDRYLSSIMGSVIENMKRGAFDPEDKGLANDRLEEKYRKVAEARARGDIIIDAIAGQEGIEVSEEEA